MAAGVVTDGYDGHDALVLRLGAARRALGEQHRRLDLALAACRATAGQLGELRGRPTSPRLFANEVVRVGGVEVLMRSQAVREGRQVRRMTPTEWQLLTFLLSNPGVVHSRAAVATGAWGEGYAERRSEVEVYVSRLRRKLGGAGHLLETVRGRGYRLVLHSNGNGAAVQPALVAESR